MPSWWGKSSSKTPKKKTTKERIIETIRKFRIPSDKKTTNRSGRGCSDTVSELGSLSRSVSPSKESKLVARCQSFQERPQAQPLPLPVSHPSRVARTESSISVSGKTRQEKGSKPSPFLPLHHTGYTRARPDAADLDGAESVFSECYSDSDDPPDSSQLSPLASDYDTGSRTTAGSPSNMIVKDQLPARKIHSRDVVKPPDHLFDNHISSSPSRMKPFFSAPDSSISSPSRSPLRTFGTEQVINTAFYSTKPLLGSGHCSSPGSGQNSMGGDMAGLFWQPSRGSPSPEYSPLPSPKMTSPGPSSRIHSGAVTPLHPRAIDSRPEDVKQRSHRLPLPPVTISNSLPFSQSNSAATSPSVPRSPGRPDNRWKKGSLLGKGSFGHVYVGFNSESGEMCAMKEVTLFSDDAKSKESAKQLSQEVYLLSRLNHPNIVRYYGSEMVDDKLYIYLEYVSGGSIYKLLQNFGQFGELAIRSYTQQILSGLSYLHAKNTVHRDIKGANILVDPNGRVKLADFGMAKHITGNTCPLSFKGSPYWMAPEIIKNSNGSNLAVDIWSLGCTVIEMATTKPPWNQHEGVAALFKIGNSKELPVIPDHLSDEGKDFVRQCLQRNPLCRPTANQLLDHPFVKNAAPVPDSDPSDPPAFSNGGIGHPRNQQALNSNRLAATNSFRVSRPGFIFSDVQIPRNVSCPVSPIGSPLLHSRMSPSPISSPRSASGTSTPPTNIPFHHVNQSVYLHEISKSTNISYHDPVPDMFRAKRQFGGDAVLADSVSHLLLRDKVNFKPSLDLNPL
ncbi:putative mitogen-activated protein kinase kinase kinase STE-STE11 family [Helianthus annuus]|uniref:mitogen-activated protein kinase kinase kinase n=1 Tax=Helianthus annuus TaxID=4232 RepID=A0A251UNC6_HELAN|nr:mitogen-activated protein kinase kinase kinase YODA [Helianthus annuus]KAF5805515.1 putative mitogen-activated protein kinase kinase kinase STE-STE11 family [Helianthus annuus]KAJ0569935.1 putative mitogen-activated protein kinase kinase kinase STE-STE11 family [Helianthus annuus]KAJ0576616.1 putative mitogen-activated protein kinase kinase kinase STE-STE11 family [Helianthus annuus]KAJ0584264.1 putative mitogen-activated protein kinase kinase kinase STE-STE11 family [Helianthus annuus]KAJ0